MVDLTPPAPGQMYLFDNMTAPLLDNAYRMSVTTEVALDGNPQPLPGSQSYLNIEGPRFSLAASEVAGVFPPRNGHGAFDQTIPHIALRRRALPWERALDPQNRIGRPAGLPTDTPLPWLTLLLFEDGEYTLHPKVALEDVVPSDVLGRLGFSRPSGITCDTVEAEAGLVAALMPSVEELSLLSHVRWVSTEDRELSAGSSDGWFSVVMSNRLPRPGSKCRACLVSVEERSDLVLRDPPPTASDFILELGDVVPVGVEGPPSAGPLAGGRDAALLEGGSTISKGAPSNRVETGRMSTGLAKEFVLGSIIRQSTVQLVLLFSWQFECTNVGTFQDLMQRLDVGMVGKVKEPGHPPLADTGHLPLKLQDRAGVTETVWYRGPLVPLQLTRDPLGPYHSADQARRVSPETGAEDISYAAAFEVGRLLAAADGRLAQELMRWRREAYRFSARKDSLAAVQKVLALPLTDDLHRPFLPLLEAAAVERFVQAKAPHADPYGLDLASRTVGLNPDELRQAWKLETVDQAAAVLGGEPGALGAVAQSPPQTARTETTIDQVAADVQGLDHLAQTRDQILENTMQKFRT